MTEIKSHIACIPRKERLCVQLMSREVQTNRPADVKSVVLGVWGEMFPDNPGTAISQGFQWAVAAFEGKYRDYQRLDALYHDMEHTLQGTLCMARLLLGRHNAKAKPQLDPRTVELGILAILLHDTGYLRKRDDLGGTGAKYTLTHVQRSMDFAAELLREKGFQPAEIKAVQNMIRCTGVNVDLTSIQFQNESERIAGLALGTSDLLGQMAASDYVDKLPILFLEFEESARFNQGKPGSGMMFASAADLKQRTPAFWEKYVVPKIEKDFLGLYRFLANPETGRNQYMERIESNIARIRQEVALATA
jgi:hypothetical protein